VRPTDGPFIQWEKPNFAHWAPLRTLISRNTRLSTNRRCLIFSHNFPQKNSGWGGGVEACITLAPHYQYRLRIDRRVWGFGLITINIPVPRRLIYTTLQWINRRPRSQNTSKELALNPEKDSKRKRPRSHVSLEKSSKNYKPLENWAKPNLLPDVTPQPANSFGELPNKLAKERGEGGVNRGLI
jgi:hypothetical protein